MTIKVGINGFGRIGRMVFRAAVQNFPDIEVVAINDLLEPDYLAYMLQHDSVHGRFKGDVAIDGDTLVVNGKRIRLTAIKDPAELKWGKSAPKSSSSPQACFSPRRRARNTSLPVPEKLSCRLLPKTTHPCLYMG